MGEASTPDKVQSKAAQEVMMTPTEAYGRVSECLSRCPMLTSDYQRPCHIERLRT